MVSNRKVILYHWPHSRSVSTHYLLEELKAEYELEIIDITKNAQKEPSFLAINAMGKIPTLRHGDVIITESTAILVYLSDLYADRGLTPAIGDPLRGPFLRWIAFYAACFEPAMANRSMKFGAARPGMMPYGDFETMWSTLVGQLKKGPYMLGDKFHTLDVLWASGLSFMTQFKVAPEDPTVADYIKRVESRPAFAIVDAKSEEILKNSKK